MIHADTLRTELEIVANPGGERSRFYCADNVFESSVNQNSIAPFRVLRRESKRRWSQSVRRENLSRRENGVFPGEAGNDFLN
jgi:hypothetical protein